MKTDEIRELYDAIEGSKNTVAITGAGISIAAGGTTYSGMRSAGGGRGAVRSGDPAQTYSFFYGAFLRSMFGHGPSHAHIALARLEAMGKMQGIITTNVDCMHTMAGSENVAEIQGSFQVNVCTGCGQVTHGYGMWNHGHMPVCEKCGKTYLPYNIYSGAGILESEMRRARRWIADADLILIIGATGCYTHLYWGYKKRASRVIQINPGHTYFDSVAYMNIRRESDPVFDSLMEFYGGTGGDSE